MKEKRRESERKKEGESQIGSEDISLVHTAAAVVTIVGVLCTLSTFRDRRVWEKTERLKIEDKTWVEGVVRNPRYDIQLVDNWWE